MPAIIASAPGKTILFGEHAVVYGYPAIAVPLTDISLFVIVQPLLDQNSFHILNKDIQEDLYLHTTDQVNHYSIALEIIRKHLEIDHLPSMQLDISSKIPLASGLGSSAAFAVALTKAVGEFLGFRLTLEKINEIAFEIEGNQHGTPSGIDNTVITYQRPVFFRKDHPIDFLKVGQPLTLVLANSGIQSLTRESVSQIRKMRESNPNEIDQIFDEIGAITEKARDFIKKGDNQNTGKLMVENHNLLKELDLSLIQLDGLVEAAVNSGAFGAKLCGGGKGGNVVALVPPEIKEDISGAMVRAGAQSCLTSTIAKTEGKS
jgi:mevalonate kinase